ncbi:MAG TPA: YbaB/EbfC family nucleoid-associated protein [Vicinamibacterales bacterium]
MNPLELMRQAKDIQERMQQQMAQTRVQATAGGGMVTVVVNGAKQLQSIQIDPSIVSKDDVEMLQDMIVAAVNDAHRKVDEQLGQSISGLMGGLKIPGLG